MMLGVVVVLLISSIYAAGIIPMALTAYDMGAGPVKAVLAGVLWPAVAVIGCVQNWEWGE